MAMTPDTINLVTECGKFAGGMVQSGTECIVVLRKDGDEVSKVDVVSGTPTGPPKELIESISTLSGIPKAQIEIFVYALVGGARGRDM